MNKYLLLRDNKQTGPYSQEELVTKGLKAYDLVWLEGKSAAWRYPSEFDELKPFAPVVEEQPYDRFYKKAASASSTEFLEARSKKETAKETIKEAVVAETPVMAAVVEEPVAKPLTIPASPAKKIYVTMPAANGNGGARIAATTIAPAKKEEYKAYEPVPVDVVQEKEKEKEKPVDNSFYKHEEERLLTAAPKRERKDNRRLVMRTLVAACLILGGVVIGLAISNSLNQSHKKDLEKLVNQIREREKNNQPPSQPVDMPANTVTEDQNIITDSTAVENNGTAEPATDIVKLPANKTTNPLKKDNNTAINTATKSTLPVSHDNTEDVNVTPAVLGNKEKIGYHEAAIESARKNIYSLVNVDMNKYKVGVLGGISELYITLSNNSVYPLEQVSVEVKYFGPEKKVVKTQTLLFNDIAAGEQKTLEVPKTNRGVSVDYSVTQINSKVLGLAKVK